MSAWIETYRGHIIYPLFGESNQPGEIDIEDIAHSLALQCRFNGHCQRFYSVAEHSIIVSKTVLAITDDPVQALQGLLHDAAEAYLCDIPTPIKQFASFYVHQDENLSFCSAENRLLQLIFKLYDLPWPIHDVVQIVDGRILADERKQLLPYGRNNEWPDMMEELHVILSCYPWYTAKRLFLEQFTILSHLRFKYDNRNSNSY